MSKNLKIVQMLVPASKHKIKCPYTMKPTRLVVHNTANSASALNEISYMIRNNSSVSFHYAVDEKEAIQGILLNRNGWHAGDGNGTGNRYGIGIEICRSKSDTATFLKAEDNGAYLCAKLLIQYGWGMGQLTKHQDYSGKYCPHKTLDLGWNRFKNLVQKYYNELKKGNSNEANKGDDKVDYKKRAVISYINKADLEGIMPLINFLEGDYIIDIVNGTKGHEMSGYKNSNWRIAVGGKKGNHSGYMNYHIGGKDREETKNNILDFRNNSDHRKNYKI